MTDDATTAENNDPMRRLMSENEDEPAEPVNAPLRLREKLVKNLEIGESAWIDNWGLMLSKTGHLFVKKEHPLTCRMSPGSVRVTRTKEGFHARLPLICRPRWMLRDLYDDTEKVTEVAYRLHPFPALILAFVGVLCGLVALLPDPPPTHYEIMCTDLENEVLLIDRGTDLKTSDHHWEWTNVHGFGKTGVDLTNRRCSYAETSPSTEKIP